MDIMKKYQEFLDCLKVSSLKHDLQDSFQRLERNTVLMEKISLYHKTKDALLRQEIYQEEEYKQYKKLENRLNKLILACNKVLGELTK